jgi:hypothetical protein
VPLFVIVHHLNQRMGTAFGSPRLEIVLQTTHQLERPVAMCAFDALAQFWPCTFIRLSLRCPLPDGHRPPSAGSSQLEFFFGPVWLR